MEARMYPDGDDPGTRSILHKIRHRTVGNLKLSSRIAIRVRREWGTDNIKAMDDHELRNGPVANVLTDIIMGNDEIAGRDAVRDLAEVHRVKSVDDTVVKALRHAGVDPLIALALARQFDYVLQTHEMVLVMGSPKPVGTRLDIRIGRSMRLLPDMRLLCPGIPESAALSLIGRPLRELVRHPVLPEEDAITRIETIQGNAVVSAIASRDRTLQELTEEARTKNSRKSRKIP